MADDSSEIVREVVEGGVATNAKVTMDGPSVYQNLALANAVSHQGRLNAITEAATGKIIESIIATSPAEGGSDMVTLMALLKGNYMQPPVGFSGSQPGQPST